MSKQLENVVVFDYPVIAQDCAEALKKLGYEVSYIDDTILQNWLSTLSKHKPLFLFSINYQPWISELAEKIQRPYISWVVDTPHFNLYYEKNKSYQYTYWFLYDNLATLDLNRKGFKNVYHAPVAANIHRFNTIILDDQNILQYNTDISFVGNTCIQNEYSQIIQQRIDTELQQTFEQIIQGQMVSQKFIISDILTDEFSNDLFEEIGITIKAEDFHNNITSKDILSMFLGRYHTFKERSIILNKLSTKYKTCVYGDEYWNNLINPTSYKGNANHFTEMPKVFNQSKINLNITRSFVQSGLPMRIFDVLGCRGFLLTNYKLEFDQLFETGKDLIVYRDQQEMLEMIDYYLIHEKEREEIALHGYKTIAQKHTFEHRLQAMLKIISF